jgi:hypothetical protein
MYIYSIYTYTSVFLYIYILYNIFNITLNFYSLPPIIYTILYTTSKL